MNIPNLAQHPISTALIMILLTGWIISDSRFDFAMDVKIALMSRENGHEDLIGKITPNSTTPDIQVNWFSSTSSIANQFFASNSASKDDNTDPGTLGKTVGEGPANDFP